MTFARRLFPTIPPLPAALLVLLLAGCSREQPAPRPRTMAEARKIVLALYGQLDGFKLERQLEANLAGLPALRMEAVWLHEGHKRRGIIYLLEQKSWFNVIAYTAPEDNGLFESGYPAFQKMLRRLKPIDWVGPLQVKEEGGEKVMRNADLQLEIHYPADWVYSFDDVNRALVFSGPSQEPTWLTTVSFAVVQRWPG